MVKRNIKGLGEAAGLRVHKGDYELTISAVNPQCLDKTEIAGGLPTQVNTAMLPNEPGVYFLFGKRSKLVYVGCSINVRARIARHLSERNHGLDVPGFTVHSVSYRLVPESADRVLLEKFYIYALRPPGNVVYNPESYPNMAERRMRAWKHKKMARHEGEYLYALLKVEKKEADFDRYAKHFFDSDDRSAWNAFISLDLEEVSTLISEGKVMEFGGHP